MWAAKHCSIPFSSTLQQVVHFFLKEQSESDVESSQASSLTEQVSLWYIMDELGSRIRHCDLPSMSLRSFYYVDRGISYSILFPNQDLEYGGNVCFRLGKKMSTLRNTDK